MRGGIDSVASGDVITELSSGLLDLIFPFDIFPSNIECSCKWSLELRAYSFLPPHSFYIYTVQFKLGSHDKGSEWKCRSSPQTVVVVSNTREAAHQACPKPPLLLKGVSASGYWHELPSGHVWSPTPLSSFQQYLNTEQSARDLTFAKKRSSFQVEVSVSIKIMFQIHYWKNSHFTSWSSVFQQEQIYLTKYRGKNICEKIHPPICKYICRVGLKKL